MRKIIFVIILAFIITLSSDYIILDNNQDSSNCTIINRDQNVVAVTTISSIQTESETPSKAYYDKNQNSIHDAIEKEPYTKRAVLICYENFPGKPEISALTKLGVEISYKWKYLNVIQTKEITLITMNEITTLPGVTFIEPMPVIKPSLSVSAPAVKARESDEYSPETAWELGYTGKGINIAVIDSGVDDEHPSLTDKFVAGVDFTGTGAVTAKDGSYNPDDVLGHGTSVAGVAMGTGSDAGTYMGIAPDAKLIDVKTVGGVGSQIPAALDWCIDHKDTDWNNNGPDDHDGIDVISISLGGGEQNSAGTGQLSQLINHVVDEGIVVVTSAGNDGPDNIGFDDVVAADKVISVGNVDDRSTIIRDDDMINPSSSQGPRRDDGDEDPYDELKPDVVAPGTNINAPEANRRKMTGFFYSYANVDGTSISCPHVSGICALMLEGNPDLRPLDIKKILQATAEARDEPSEPELSDKYNYAYGFGIVDAYEAVKMGLEFEPKNNAPELISIVADPMNIAPNGQSTITTTASDPDGDPLDYEYQVTGGEIQGTGFEVTWVAPEEVGKYDITVTVNDGLLTSEPASVTITVETEPGNDPPIVEEIYIDQPTLEPEESTEITVTATDPDGDELFYEYEPNGGIITGTGPKVIWTAPDELGEYEITIIVSDWEFSIESEIELFVYQGGANRPPVIESFTASSRSTEIGSVVTLIVKANDPESAKLSYSYFATGGQIIGFGANINWTAPDNPDSYVIEVTVTDSEGLTDSEDIVIEVFQPNTGPAITDLAALPNSLPNDGTGEVLFTVTVKDLNGLQDISKVTIDLSSIGGSGSRKMYDNGKHGDIQADDGVYSYSYLIPKGTSGGQKKLPATVADWSEESMSLYLVFEVFEVSEDKGDEGILDEFLPTPGFDAGVIILVFMFMIIILISKRNKTNKKCSAKRNDN